MALHTEPIFRLSSGRQRIIAQGIGVTRQFCLKLLVMSIFLSYYISMDTVFSGKKAIVIGGTSGIGRAISLGLVAAGASVCAQGRHSVPDMESLVLDLDNPENLDIMLARVQNADILCINRGPFLQKPLDETSKEEWESIIFNNLTFPGMLVSSVLSYMCMQKWGRILLLGGTRTDVIRGFRTNAAYAAAKTGLSSLVKSVALEYASSGITCNAICPGFVDSENLKTETKEVLARKNPDGKLVSMQEIAEAALFLLKTNNFNGVLLPVDKGWDPSFI